MKKTVTVSPGLLSGSVTAPPSKSLAHRAVLCAALAQGTSTIQNIAYSQDILATISAAKQLGATVEERENTLVVTGADIKRKLQNEDFFCNESGSTLRFLIPIALSLGGQFSVSGAGRLMERPLNDYFEICEKQKIDFEKRENQVFFSGKLIPGTFMLSGNVSSQYITGLLFALPLLDGDSEIQITTPVESIGYIDLTISVMKYFGVCVEMSDDYRLFRVRGNQTYQPREFTVEGDYSQAAFYLVANAIGSSVKVYGLQGNSRQGDKEVLDIIEELCGENPVHTIDVSQVPDLVPILSVLAVKSKGITKFVNASRLRIKESDRLHAVAEELTKLGANIKEYEDALEIQGNGTFRGGEVDSHNDHRMTMSLAIAATVATGDVVINGADSVQKSYGDFWKKIDELGGKTDYGSDLR